MGCKRAFAALWSDMSGEASSSSGRGGGRIAGSSSPTPALFSQWAGHGELQRGSSGSLSAPRPHTDPSGRQPALFWAQDRSHPPSAHRPPLACAPSLPYFTLIFGDPDLPSSIFPRGWCPGREAQPAEGGSWGPAALPPDNVWEPLSLEVAQAASLQCGRLQQPFRQPRSCRLPERRLRHLHGPLVIQPEVLGQTPAGETGLATVHHA